MDLGRQGDARVRDEPVALFGEGFNKAGRFGRIF